MNLFRIAAAVLVAVPAAVFAGQAEETPICTDRPAKANAVCTVPVGNWQLESQAVGWSRTEAGGARTDIWQVGASVLKYGLTDRSDLQIGFTPFVEIDSGPDRLSGVGDMTVRYKHRLTGDDSKVQIAAIPFIKLPTAKRGIGNGKVEGGLALPVSIATGSPVTVVLGPELDLLADGDGDGYHAALVNVVNLSGTVAPRLTVAGELWTMTNFDPGGTVTLVSADGALAYAVSPSVQLDAGANLGLTRDTPNTELYLGVSWRF